MKFNWKKFLLINFSLCIIILIAAEIIAYCSYNAKYMPLVVLHSKIQSNPEEFIKKNKPHYQMPRQFNYEAAKKTIFHHSFISKNSKKRPIITIGCSFAYGALLEDKQTFAYKLHELTGRTTYNKGVCATGPQMVYRQLSDENFMNEVPDAEYVIYIFIQDHLFRQIRDLVMPYGPDIELGYAVKNGELIPKPRPFWFMYGSFLVKTYLEYANEKAYRSEMSNDIPLFLKIMEKSVYQMHKNYPNSKFVFLEYPESSVCDDSSLVLNKQAIQNLKNLGIIYINASELVGHDFCDSKYWAKDKYHPSELAWNEITPKLVERLRL